MKKIIFFVFCLVSVLLGGYAGFARISSDRTGPEITWEGERTAQADLTDAQLLEGVSAYDETDGDVTDSLIVESYSFNDTTGEGIVSYVARDSGNNVSKATRILPADPDFTPASETETETETQAQEVNAASASGANGSGNAQTPAGGTSLAGGVGYAVQETETETETETGEVNRDPYVPFITLSARTVRISRGDSFDPLDYVQSIEDADDNYYTLWQNIQIDGDYDVNTAGTYVITYYVVDASGNVSNRPQLRLVVS